MKKETFTEKMIKRTYGITGPLDEQKRREADRIGNQVFLFLLPLLIFGNGIPLLLAQSYPQVVALVYPTALLFITLGLAAYISYQSRKVGLTTIDQDLLYEKEKKQLHLVGLKSGLIFGTLQFFMIPLIYLISGETDNYLQTLLTPKTIFSAVFGALIFGVLFQLTVTKRVKQAKEEQDDN